MARLPKQELIMKNPVGSSVVWFVDEALPTNPTIGLNSQGIHFNRRAVHETGWKPGQCVQVGLSEGRLIFRSNANGVLLKKVSGDSNGALRIVNKRLVGWLQSKGVPLKRFTLLGDQNGLYYIELERYE